MSSCDSKDSVTSDHDDFTGLRCQSTSASSREQISDSGNEMKAVLRSATRANKCLVERSDEYLPCEDGIPIKQILGKKNVRKPAPKRRTPKTNNCKMSPDLKK